MCESCFDSSLRLPTCLERATRGIFKSLDSNGNIASTECDPKCE